MKLFFSAPIPGALRRTHAGTGTRCTRQEPWPRLRPTHEIASRFEARRPLDIRPQRSGLLVQILAGAVAGIHTFQIRDRECGLPGVIGHGLDDRPEILDPGALVRLRQRTTGSSPASALAR